MTEKKYNPSMLDEGFGALAIAACIVSSPLSRPWYSKWGATSTEVEMPLPGDELVPDPRLVSTRAITIQAPPSVIWPWLVQMGQGRGGLYSYERLENLVGCDMHNADRIFPELQDLKIGDKVHLSPDLSFDVAAIEPEKTLITRGDTPNPGYKTTTWIWIFYLDLIDEKTTRLLLRTRLDYEPTMGNMLMWRVFTDPVSFNMERKMLQGIKLRVEATATN